MHLDNRKSRIKMRKGFGRIFNADDRTIPMRREAGDIANCEERRQSSRVAGLPRFADYLRPYARRVTDRDGQWQFQSANRHQL
jgi:hypothetical protein